jgi:hypothetical protein
VNGLTLPVITKREQPEEEPTLNNFAFEIGRMQCRRVFAAKLSAALQRVKLHSDLSGYELAKF